MYRNRSEMLQRRFEQLLTEFLAAWVYCQSLDDVAVFTLGYAVIT